MNINIILLTILLFCVTINLVAQDDESNKNLPIKSIENSRVSNIGFYVDGGTIILFNAGFVNLEGRIISPSSSNFHLYGRIGFGKMMIARIFKPKDESLGGITALTMLIGKDKHYFEVNTGVFLGTGRKWRKGDVALRKYPVVELGYRFQKKDNGIIVRAKIGTLGLGLGLGYAF